MKLKTIAAAVSSLLLLQAANPLFQHFPTETGAIKASAAQSAQSIYYEDQAYLKGDINNDSAVTSTDLVLLSRYLLACKIEVDAVFQRADMNNDGVLDVFDLVILRKMLTGSIPLEIVEPPATETTSTTVPITTSTTTTTTTQQVTTTTEPAKIEYTSVTADVKGAESADITLSGSPYAGINGTVGYWDNSAGEWVTSDYEGTLDANGSYAFNFVVPSGTEEIQVQIYWSGVWDNDSQTIVDAEAEISDIKVNYAYQPSDELISAPVNAINAATPSTGNVKMLAIYVDFADKTYSSSAYSNEDMENELFGTGSASYPYESLSAWFERSSYGNLHVDGDVYSFTCSENMSNYQSGGFEKMVMEVMSGLDSQIDYSDYDSNSDGIIDCISFTVPLDGADSATLEYWYGCTATWYDNPSYSVDGMKLSNYIIMDVMPYSENMVYLKQTLIHEMGHSMGLPDYYKYQSSDWEGLKGDAGYARMDDSIADFCGFSKLMYGWLRKSEIQSYSGSGSETFELSDASNSGSCLILPISSSGDDYNSEYFLVEYITASGNNSDMYSSDNGGIRIFHVQAELYTSAWGDTNFKYENYSEFYAGDDNIRVLKLVNDGNGFFHSGDTVSFGTSNFAAYDSSGQQTVDTGYTISIGSVADGKYSVTVSK